VAACAQSAKPAVVMAYSSAFLGKHYGGADYTAVLIMVLGLGMFVLGDARATPRFDPLGV
jgi:NADH:ubiquinone oxidoreductase subunit F (NADH-binding)